MQSKLSASPVHYASYVGIGVGKEEAHDEEAEERTARHAEDADSNLQQRLAEQRSDEGQGDRQRTVHDTCQSKQVAMKAKAIFNARYTTPAQSCRFNKERDDTKCCITECLSGDNCDSQRYGSALALPVEWLHSVEERNSR